MSAPSEVTTPTLDPIPSTPWPHFGTISGHESQIGFALAKVTWKDVTVDIPGPRGAPITKVVRAPVWWDESAVRIVASRYLRGHEETAETGVDDVVARLSTRMSDYATRAGLIATPEEYGTAWNEIATVLIEQLGVWATPVLMNVGDPAMDDYRQPPAVVDEVYIASLRAQPRPGENEYRPQISACFITPIEDSLQGIQDTKWIETSIFSRGSGSGINISNLRGRGEPLSRGGASSGAVSFMYSLDANAAAIKSGGRTRRSARMVIMDADHPDLIAFIESKVEADKIARLMVADGGYTHTEILENTPLSTANHSVRVTDEFMLAVVNDEPWLLVERTTGETTEVSAREIFDRIVDAAHKCGDPGMQFDTTINAAHPCPVGGRQNASNPCSEYLFLDLTSCNLAALRPYNFLIWEDGRVIGFDTARYRAVATVLAVMQDTMITFAGTPTPAFDHETKKYRTIGLGLTGLGETLMAMGVPYGSDTGRMLARVLMGLTHATAVETSAFLAERLGSFPAFEENADHVKRVLHNQHKSALDTEAPCMPDDGKGDLYDVEADTSLAGVIYADLYAAIKRAHGATLKPQRNAQHTVAAPNGTTSFFVGSKWSTGIEPLYDLAVVKKLADGGTVVMETPQCMVDALRALQYTDVEIQEIRGYVSKHGTIVGSGVKERHYPVFATADGDNALSPDDHVLMLAAMSKVVSGGLSKTVNLPETATHEDIARVYMSAWKLHVKSVSVFRAGSKAISALYSKSKVEEPAQPVVEATAVAPPVPVLSEFGPPSEPTRIRPPESRPSITHKATLDGYEFYVVIGFYPGPEPRIAEVFVSDSTGKATLATMTDSWATLASMLIQVGYPIPKIVEKFRYQDCAPQGLSRSRLVPMAPSILSYVCGIIQIAHDETTWAGLFARFGFSLGSVDVEVPEQPAVLDAPEPVPGPTPIRGGRLCPQCGKQARRTGSCWSCGCGWNTGCSG